jgi:hypothetical protein
VTDDELDRLRNNILSALIILRDQTGQQIWLDKRVLASKISHAGPMSDFIAAVGSLTQLDYVEIDRDLKPRDELQDFSNIRLTNAGQAFYDNGNRFVQGPDQGTGTPPPSNAILTEAGDFLVTEDGDYLVTEAEVGSELGEAYNSASWTGLPSNFVISQGFQSELIELLNTAERNLESVGASNSEKAIARAYIVAARTLAETPEPPADLIWEIVNRANSLAGIASLFVSIIALFMATAK